MVLHEGGNYDDMISTGLEPRQSSGATVPADTPMAPAEKKEGWVHHHPYLASSIVVVALIVFGGFLFLQRNDVTPADTIGAWGGAGGAFFNGIRAATHIAQTADQTQSPPSKQAASFIPLPSQAADTSQEAAAPNEDIAALLALLVQPSAGASASSNTNTPDAYSFIPQGLVTVPTIDTGRTVTPGQEISLHEYGNEIGAYIQGFENLHGNAIQTLKNHIEDRSDPQKSGALERLGLDMEDLGRNLAQMDFVPPQAQGMHAAYATAYETAGANLQKVAQTTSDDAFVDAIGTYNSSVDELTNRFLLLVALFGANDVIFSSSDPGSIFMFNANVGL